MHEPLRFIVHQDGHEEEHKQYVYFGVGFAICLAQSVRAALFRTDLFLLLCVVDGHDTYELRHILCNPHINSECVVGYEFGDCKSICDNIGWTHVECLMRSGLISFVQTIRSVWFGVVDLWIGGMQFGTRRECMFAFAIL